MAVMAGSVCVTVTLLMCVVGSEALDLLRAAGTSGYPRSPPKVHCRCASYPNLTLCSWPEPSHLPPTHYIATYSERHRELDIKQCQLIPPSSSSSALISSSSSEKIWRCYLPNLKLLTDYIINITAVYPSGDVTYLRRFMLEDVVKPDPPVDIRFSTNHTRNLLEWSAPPTWGNLHIFPLKYQILYELTSRSTRRFFIKDYEDTKFELKGLISLKTYVFQVCAMELLGLGECSAYSSPIEITMP
ncbi:hypothetical protein PAMP_005833 [Pampus punctatissimus]